MTEIVKKLASGVLENSSADKLIFSEKSTSTTDLFPSGQSNSSPPPKASSGDAPVTPKDFYWDQILFYLVSAILGLSFLDISVEFFRGSAIQCFFASNITRDQVNYFNNFCYGSLPTSQYYLVFILISALVIIAPHYLWSSFFGAHFAFFFDLVRKLNRLRDSSIGDYSPLNFELVKKLEEKFSTSNTWIFRLYKVKLIFQLIFSTIILLLNAFYFKDEDFDETFACPKNKTIVDTPEWPIENHVMCVYNSLTLLHFLLNTALGLVAVCIIIIIVGLHWCFSRHPVELGAKNIASFCELSCLPPEDYPLPSIRKVVKKIICCGKEESGHKKVHNSFVSAQQSGIIGNPVADEDKEDKEDNKCSVESVCCPCFTGFWQSLKEAFTPRISNDLDFLLMRLYYADSGHGEVFKDIQIHKELQEKTAQDHELLYLLNIVHTHLLKKKIKIKLENRARQRRNQQPLQDDGEFERLKDLKEYFYQSNFKNSDPEKQVYDYFKKEMGISIKDWSFSPLRSVLFGFLNYAPDNKLALDLSFGSKTGHSLVLARAFYQVVTVHFNKYFKNSEKTCKCEEYQVNYRTFTFQSDIFSQNATNIFQSEQLIIDLFQETIDSYKVDLIVIGPMTNRSKIVTANVLIEKMYARETYFNEGMILLAVRPLMIGSKPCTNRFIQYQPPQGIFKDISDEVRNDLLEKNVKVYRVSPKGTVTEVIKRNPARQPSTLRRVGTRLMNAVTGDKSEMLPEGVVVQCNDVQCIYEFRLFRYNSQSPPEFSNDNGGIASDVPPAVEPPLARLLSLPSIENGNNNTHQSLPNLYVNGNVVKSSPSNHSLRSAAGAN